MRRIALAVLVALALPPAGRAADRPWALIRTRDLTVVGQQSPKTLRDIALRLEQFRVVVGGLIANAQRPLPLPTVVYVFGTHKELEPFLPLYNGKPISASGYFHHDEETNAIALALDGYDESARIVFHEYAHLLIRNAVRTIPPWLNEGLAEYYSTYALEPDGTRAHIGRPIVWDVALLRERFVPLTALIAVDYTSPMYNEKNRQSIFYAESWALTHYLMMGVRDGRAAINRYVVGVARGGTPDDVFVEAFGKTPAEFEKELKAYVRSAGFKSGVFVFPEKVEVDAPDPGRMLSAGEAAAWAGDLQLRVGLLSQGAARIESAAAAAPDAAKAQLALASLRLRQHRVDEALPLFERAVVLTPEDFSAQFALGVSLLRREVIGGRFGGNTPAVARARAALAKAAELNAASSEAFAWLAYAEMVTDGRLAAAMTAIRRAIDLAPGRLDYVLRFADICILGGALPEARKVLTDVSHVTTDPDAVEGAARRLEVLREREAQERAADGARSAATAAAAGETVSPDGGAKPSNAATIELELEPEPELARLTAENFRLRKVQRGEERAYGELTELECDAAQVRFHLRVGSRIIIATAKRMEDITLTEFVGNKDFAVACGKRDPADTVFLTWRAAPLRAEAAATIVGEAVALEIVPRGFTP